DEVFLHLEVPRPGEYHVRVAIDDGATGRTASVYDIVDVPDFERAAVSLSGLAIATAAVLPRAATRSDFLPVAPTLQRTFSWTDEVSAYVQVVQPGQVPLGPIALTVRVLDEQGEARFERVDILPAGLFNAAGHADFAFVVPTDALTSGTYTLVLDAARDATRATRSARFEIE